MNCFAIVKTRVFTAPDFDRVGLQYVGKTAKKV
jgi:hypothetical protein